MFLEDSTVGREAWRELYLSLLKKVSELFPVVLQQEVLRDGPLCYIAVKVQGGYSLKHTSRTCGLIVIAEQALLSL